MKKEKRLLICILLLAAALIFLSGMPVFAGDGSGSGNGSGEGGDPLVLVSSEPADGQKDVSPSSQITLTFSKNVVNMSVNENNEKCFELYDADGKKAQIKVIMADDQIEPEKKRIIVIAPTEKLQSGINYTLKILPELSSKSGVTLGQTKEVKFTAAGGQEQKDAEPVQKTAEPVQKAAEPQKSIETATTVESTPKEQPTKDTKTENEIITAEKENESSDANNYNILFFAVILAAAVVGFTYYQKKKK